MTHITTRDIDQDTGTAVTLGNFDGLHRGHQKLIEAVMAEEKSTRVVFSFFPHPVSVFKAMVFRTILTSAEKSLLLKDMGVDTFIEYPFDPELAGLDAEQFVHEILVTRLRCKTLVVGEGYRFGSGGRGDNILLRRLGERYGFTVKTIPHVMAGDTKISSSYVREAIMQKRLAEAEELMGRPYLVMGEVVHGNRLGHTINVPTANIRPPEYKLLPPPGVYRTRVKYCGRTYRGLTNVGVRPTVNDGMDEIVETHLLDFDGDLYGQSLTVEFYGWMRPERRFDGIDELREQIMRDISSV